MTVPAGVTAVRLPLDPGPPIDPFALAGTTGILFHAEGRVLVGLGSALRMVLANGLDSVADVRSVTEALASLPCDDRFDSASSGVMAFTSLPFERSAPASLVVPAVIYGSEPDGREWVTVVADGAADGTTGSLLPSSPGGLRSWLAGAPAAVGRPGAGLGPVASTELRIEPRTPDTQFLAMVADALSAIDGGQLTKVVLARQVDVTLSAPIDVPALLRRWHDLEPNCTIFSLPTPDGQFVGASPELLLERSGTRIHSRPLAGTAERFIGSGGSVLPGELLESRKDANEHRVVVEAIRSALATLCSELDAPAQPELVHLRNIIHLGTSLNGTLARRPDGTAPSALELVEALHPTPAVGGVPATAARAAIGQLEPESRGHYAGPVGYVDATGDGRWMVGIRAMTIDRRTARLAAGVGIVDGSVPTTELAETNLKLTAVLDALAPGFTVAAAAATEPAEVTATQEPEPRRVAG